MSIGTPIALKYGHRYLYAEGLGASDPLVLALGEGSSTPVSAGPWSSPISSGRCLLRSACSSRSAGGTSTALAGSPNPCSTPQPAPTRRTHPFVAPDPSDPNKVRGRTYTPDGLWLKGSPSDYDLVAEYKPEGTGFCLPDDDGAVAEMFDPAPPPSPKPPSPEAQLAAAVRGAHSLANSVVQANP